MYKSVFYTNIPILQQSEIAISSLIIELLKIQEGNSWNLVSNEIPPANITLLAKDPEGVVHLSNWRSSYKIFSCQEKNELSENWKWKTI